MKMPIRTVGSGELVTLSAEETMDPDGDRIGFKWWQYYEAGTYKGMIQLENPFQKKLSFVAPNVDEPSTIHFIFQVTDRGKPALISYKRMIITVIP